MNARRNGKTKRRRSNGRQSRGSAPGGTMEGAVVVADTLNAEATVPFGVIEPDEGVQVDSEGAPVQVIATAALNPPAGVTCRLYVAVPPAVTEAVAEPPLATSIEKSVPVPVRATF